MNELTSIEICAGAGGQALGLERAGFRHLALVEIDPWACSTLRLNRPAWNVLGPQPHEVGRAWTTGDVRDFDATQYRGEIHLLAGGVPCPPFSKAGKQLGGEDERDLFPEAMRLVRECDPRAVMLENVRGLLDPKFAAYRHSLQAELDGLGYTASWRLYNACDFGVPQLRPRAILVAVKRDATSSFVWPEPHENPRVLVGDALRELMAEGGWEGAEAWAAGAQRVAPTLVGGSKKHGGPDLGPTRAKREWASLGVDGLGLADQPPVPGFRGMPRLTVRMAAVVQGFPPEWEFAGRKTHAYRQVGNAFPPPIAAAVGGALRDALIAANVDRVAVAV